MRSEELTRSASIITLNFSRKLVSYKCYAILNILTNLHGLSRTGAVYSCRKASIGSIMAARLAG